MFTDTIAILSNGLLTSGSGTGNTDPNAVLVAVGGNYIAPAAGDLREGTVVGAGDYEVVGTLVTTTIVPVAEQVTRYSNPPTFYHSISRNIIIAFGNIFNSIHLQRRDATKNVIQDIIVPILYGPKEKFIAAIRDSQGDEMDQTGVAIKLPRLAFSIGGFTYDTARKVNSVAKIKYVEEENGDVMKYSYTPIPYNLTIVLSVMSRNTEDAMQIMEQIIPYFTPEYNVSINEIPALAVVRDIPVILDSIQPVETYEYGPDEKGKITTIDLSFTVKANFYGPVRSQGVIKKVIEQFYDKMPEDTTPEVPTSTSLVNAVSRITVSVDPITANSAYDYGYTETYLAKGDT